MKIVTMCYGGNSRSVAMSYLLKGQGHDVLTCGCGANSGGTLKMLFDWADVIVVMADEFLPRVPGEYMKKAVVVEVTTDWIGLPMYVPQKFFDYCGNIWRQIMSGWNGIKPWEGGEK